MGIRRSRVRAVFLGPITHEAVVEASGSAAVTLDASGVATVGIVASGTADIGLSARGDNIVATGSASVGLSAQGGDGIVGVVASGSAGVQATAGPGTAVIGVGCSGSAAVGLGVGGAAFAAIPIEASGSASIEVSARGSVQVAELYSAFVLNVRSRGHALYSNYPFNSLFCLDGEYYGISATGIESLSGANDKGTAIAGSMLTGLETFGSNVQKALDSVELQVRTAGAMEVETIHGETEKRTGYPVAIDGRTGLRGRRRKLAKGPSATSWQIGIKNVAGADFDLPEFSVIVDQLPKKV